MSDLISRQDAIDALMNDPDWADAIPTIKSIPSAEPKTGEWITDIYKYGKERHVCSNCGRGHREESDYCPNCGSYNGGGEEE